MSVEPWFAQPEDVVGTAILLPGRRGRADTPVLHWPATLLTELGWSVLVVGWAPEGGEPPASAEVLARAETALVQARPDRPVLIVAKSLGTLALPWAAAHDLPGAWLTPLLGEPAVRAAVAEASAPTLLVGGTADPHWRPSGAAGPGVQVLELPGADHGLQRAGDWRGSLLGQVTVFDRIARLAATVRDPSAQAL